MGCSQCRHNSVKESFSAEEILIKVLRIIQSERTTMVFRNIIALELVYDRQPIDNDRDPVVESADLR
uniref:Uncharacterized protein n=1 Tax=Panagrolaimus superbus TaxID=310955 RepID=A0A914YA91_9BILA